MSIPVPQPIAAPGGTTALRKLVTPSILRRAILDAFVKLLPQHQWRNPVMFVVYLGSILTTILWLQALGGMGEAAPGFILAVAAWLWATVLFANFAEAIAEGRSKAQAESLRSAKRAVEAKKLATPVRGTAHSLVASTLLRKGDVFLVEAGDFIPADGEVLEGVASVDESAITGESAPVIRESGGDFSSVTGGTRVLSDWLVVRVTANVGESFLDRMISMVEGARRQKTPNEIALEILLVGLTLVFLLATVTLLLTYPQLGALNVMRLATPNSAILSAVIFNALIIVALVPLALKGVRYRPLGAAAVLRRNLWIYGAGGVIVPFIGIKAIDLLLVLSGLT